MKFTAVAVAIAAAVAPATAVVAALPTSSPPTDSAEVAIPELPDGWHYAAATDIPEASGDTPELPATVVDGTGAEVEVTDVSRIVVGGDDVAEILGALGLAENVYATPDGSTSPIAAAAPVHFEFNKGSGPEGLLSVDGTLFIGNNPARHGEVAASFRDAGVAAVVLDDAWSTPDKIRAVAEYVGLVDAGEQLATAVTTQLDEAAALGEGLDLTILQVTASGAGGAHAVVGTGTAGADIIAVIGCTSVGVEGGLRGYSVEYSDEGILAAMPDVILMTTSDVEKWGGAAGFEAAFPSLADTPAVLDGRIVVMPDDQVKYAGPASGAGAKALAELLVELQQGDAS